jgi:hypothetical protein
MQRFTPISPTKSVMRYEVYRHKNASDEDFNLISDMYKRIMSEDKYLCIRTQKNLNTGVFINGQLHPEMEKGPLHFQKTVREVVTEHRKKEEAAGHEIWPAHKCPPKNPIVSEDDITFRARMDSYSNEKDDLRDSLSGSFAAPIAV